MDLTGLSSKYPARNLLFANSDPGAALSVSRSLSNNISQNVPTDQNNALGVALLQLLQQYQNMGRQNQAAAEREQVRRIMQSPTEFIGASPSIQQSVIRSGAQAVEPTIGGARTLVSETGDVISGLKDYLNLVQSQKEQAKKDTLSFVKDAVTNFGSSAFKGATDQEISQIEQTAGLPKGTIRNWSEMADKIRKQESDLEWAKLNKGSTPSGIPSDAQKPLLQIQGVIDSVNQIFSLADELKGTSTGLKSRLRGIGQKISGSTGGNPDVTQFESLRQSLIGPLARAISGEVGVLTDRDIKRAEGLLPKLGETEAEINKKFNNLVQTLSDRASAVSGVYGVDATSLLKNMPQKRDENVKTMGDGSQWRQNSNGSWTRIK